MLQTGTTKIYYIEIRRLIIYQLSAQRIFPTTNRVVVGRVRTNTLMTAGGLNLWFEKKPSGRKEYSESSPETRVDDNKHSDRTPLTEAIHFHDREMSTENKRARLLGVFFLIYAIK